MGPLMPSGMCTRQAGQGALGSQDGSWQPELACEACIRRRQRLHDHGLCLGARHPQPLPTCMTRSRQRASAALAFDGCTSRTASLRRCASCLFSPRFSASSKEEKGTVTEEGSEIQSGSRPRRPARFFDLAPTTCRRMPLMLDQRTPHRPARTDEGGWRVLDGADANAGHTTAAPAQPRPPAAGRPQLGPPQPHPPHTHTTKQTHTLTLSSKPSMPTTHLPHQRGMLTRSLGRDVEVAAPAGGQARQRPRPLHRAGRAQHLPQTTAARHAGQAQPRPPPSGVEPHRQCAPPPQRRPPLAT